MRLDRSMLFRLCPNYPNDRIDLDVSTFNLWSEVFGIVTPIRQVHFFAQLAHESGEFRYLEENLNYSSARLLQVFPKYFDKDNVTLYAHHPEKIASRVYSNRMGNGSESSMDGWKYRGRGYLQLTGKSNYESYAASGYCVGDLLSHPEWLCNSPGRMKSAMWYFSSRGCNRLADDDDIKSITRKINGGYNGLADRMYYWRKAKRVFMLE